jgi:PAS domain S-box-containing protein
LIKQEFVLVAVQKTPVDHPSENGPDEVAYSSGYQASSFTHKTRWVLTIGSLFIVLYIISTNNYLLFHSLVELISIAIAVSIFSLAWTSRNYLDNSFLLLIGVAYLFTGGLDLVHTISYKGMGILEDSGANPPTQLWIAARYMQSLSLLAAPFFLHRRTATHLLLLGYGTVSTLLLASILFWNVFPDCYISGQGLTPFKIISEYLISVILFCSIVTFTKNRHEFESNDFRWFILAIVFTIFSELAFTFYVSVYGISNLAGHYFKLISVLYVYRVIVVSGLRKPYRELQVKEKGLGEAQRIAQLGSWEWNAIDNKEKWSDEQFRIFGYEPGGVDPNYESFVEALHPEDRDRVLEAVKRTLDNSEPYDIEFRIILPDKSEKTIHAQGELIRNEAGEPERMIGTNLDITERKEVEERLRNTELKYRSVVENANEVIFVTQGERVKYFNPRAIEWTGYSEDGIFSTPFINFIHPEDRERVKREYGERIAGDKNFSRYKTRIITQNGDVKWVLVNSSQIDWEGSPAALTMLSDITETKEAEKELRLKESAIASSINGIGITDLAGRIIYVNDSLVSMWDYEKAEEMLGRPLPEFWDGDGIFEIIRILQEKGQHQGEDTAKRKDGSVFDVQFSANILEDEDGNPAYMSASFLDVTRQKQIEKDLGHLAGRLLTVQEEERRRLARELHDDLTQRLAELAINAGKLKMEAACSSDAATVLESMQEKLVRISEDVHAISRQLHPSIIEDLGLVDGLSSECDSFSRRTDMQVRFEHDDFSEKLPHDIAICLFRVAQEGLRNVGKHAQSDSAQVRLTRENGEILLVVSDNGTGFDPKVVRKKPGLGLVSMRERLRLVGGSMLVNSQLGEGCEVRARIIYNPSKEN